MALTASDLVSYYRPSECGLRIFLRQHGQEEEPPSPFDELLIRLGRRHEQSHLASLGAHLDISSLPEGGRLARTKEAVATQNPTIYQARLEATANILGSDVRIIGEPDFLLFRGSGYAIRDCKIALRINEKDHPEILLQLQLYGWLFERNFGKAPIALEVYSGRGAIVPIAHDKGTAALGSLSTILAIRSAQDAPYSPVGWSKCGDCGFRNSCLGQAKAKKDVALIIGVDQGLATTLHDLGVHTWAELARYDVDKLTELKRPFGNTERKVGGAAPKVTRFAEVMEAGKEVLLAKPAIPDVPNYCILDLEGMPPHLDELEKIYLWGLQVYGKDGGEYLPATADYGPAGEKKGWEQFLGNAEAVFSHYGDLPMVHWAHYERTKLDMLTGRYGDRAGIAERVKNNLMDLLRITQDSIVLPLPSYSLKVVEEYVGFKRTLKEYGGDWAMAKYIEATETEDEGLRESVMGELLAYNREDLAATWTVLQWLKSRSS